MKTTTIENFTMFFAKHFGYFPDRHVCRTERLFPMRRKEWGCHTRGSPDVKSYFFFLGIAAAAATGMISMITMIPTILKN